MKVEYVTHWGTDLTPVNAARVSFANESEWEVVEVDVVDPNIPSGVTAAHVLSSKDTKLIHYLARNKHTSCFEHQGATLRLKVPIFIARQIQRHRTFSYNEISRRYVDTPPEFFWPDAWRKRADNVKQGSSDDPVPFVVTREDKFMTTPQALAESALRHALFAYEELLAGEVAPELARMVLPQNMYTEFYMSGNLRSWSHFLALRLDGHAQLEVQQVAQEVQDILMPLWPVSMDALSQNPS